MPDLASWPVSLGTARGARLCFASMLVGRIHLTFPQLLRHVAAVVAIVALLLPGVAALAETLSASDLPACCNTVYCPLHHRQMQNLGRDKSLCDTTRSSAQDGCSMRACDSPSRPAVGTAVFLLPLPVALRSPAIVEAAPVLVSRFFPNVAAIPLTPPPRTLLG